MTNPVKYIMKVFYATENYGKYGIQGMNYFMALMGATIYLMVTGFMILSIFAAIFPEFDKYESSISHKTHTIPSAILVLGCIYFILRISTKEDTLKDPLFTKKYVSKAMSYLIAYGILCGVIFIFFLGLKFSHH